MQTSTVKAYCNSLLILAPIFTISTAVTAAVPLHAQGEPFTISSQTAAYAQANANDRADQISQHPDLAQVSAVGDEQSQCSAGDQNVSNATAQARVTRDLLPRGIGFTLSAAAAATGGHWVRCGSCTLGLCLGRFPYDTDASALAHAATLIDFHFDSDARPIRYDLVFKLDANGLSAGLLPGVSLLDAQGKQILSLTSADRSPVKRARVTGGPGQSFQLRVELQAATRGHGFMPVPQRQGGPLTFSAFFERAAFADSSDTPFVAGDPTDGFPAVGALLWDGRLQCTGTLIGPHTVLTAAHCVYGYPDVTRMRFIQGSDVASEQRASRIADTVYLQQPLLDGVPGAYDDKTFDNDLAIVHLVDELGPTLPLAGDKASPQQDVPDLPTLKANQSTFMVVGFGNETVTDPATGASGEQKHGIKRLAKLLVASLDSPTKFFYNAPSGGPCRGDSGGPALVMAGGQPYVIGVSSGGEDHCTGFGSEMQIAPYLKWIKTLIQ
ncbi:MAG: S1 family peptidase [Acidobacteriota bacterium]|nr:S1 family peptidase [Acidobacteriota bacterium]